MSKGNKKTRLVFSGLVHVDTLCMRYDRSPAVLLVLHGPWLISVWFLTLATKWNGDYFYFRKSRVFPGAAG
jgi:hypothetical protein